MWLPSSNLQEDYHKNCLLLSASFLLLNTTLCHKLSTTTLDEHHFKGNVVLNVPLIYRNSNPLVIISLPKAHASIMLLTAFNLISKEYNASFFGCTHQDNMQPSKAFQGCTIMRSSPSHKNEHSQVIQYHLSSYAKYSKLDVDALVKKLSHIIANQQDDSCILFRIHERLFSGELGCYTHTKFHIDEEKNDQPAYEKSTYSSLYPRRNIQIELDHLVALETLSYQGASK